jgi:hypothetical protein
MLIIDSGESFTELAMNVEGVEETLAGSSVARGPPTESLKVTVAVGLVEGITTGVGGIDATVGVPTAEDMIGMGVAEVRTDGVLIQDPELWLALSRAFLVTAAQITQIAGLPPREERNEHSYVYLRALGLLRPFLVAS